MRRALIACAIAQIVILSSCTEKHLIADRAFRQRVETDFLQRKKLAANRDSVLFSVFDRPLSSAKQEALKFLFAYMPLSDLADYTGDFFLLNAEAALRTRIKSPWGKEVPEDIFLHYVLPVRVNNENLDSFRIAYFDEISARIIGMDAGTAALEINHWCHEKVSYQPADIRTSAPVSTMLSARGRCGEESTFTVAALRTAGLPARQVYTPRWAHSDDNHAWVEVWINGSWYYMGACEPEPVLDRGWFTEPARRAMLTNTKSFGASSKMENSIVTFRNYSIINTLSKYAVTKTVVVKVLDNDRTPAGGAAVEYQLYNNAEFYPLAVVPADRNGISRFETGLGDLIVWAYKGDKFSYRKITVNDTDTLTLVLDMNPRAGGYYEYDLGVPVVRSPLEGPSPELAKANGDRLNRENSIREEYIRTWMTPGQANELALATGTGPALIKDIIRRSMGNYKTITSFLAKAPAEDKYLTVKLLTLIADKDLRDIKEDALQDHLLHAFRYENAGNAYDSLVYYDYVLNPRIANEIIVPWRKDLFDGIPVLLRQDAINDPSLLVKYVSDRISLNDSDNYYRTPLTPRGTGELRVSDSFSRDIYFVAICRTLGIPARLEPGSRVPQYYFSSSWHDVNFNENRSQTGRKGFLRLVTSEKQPVPEYYIHFTIARFENGRYNTLEYPENKRVTDFTEEIALAPGHYMLVTGNRLSDSRILSSVSFFELSENEHKRLEIKLRKDTSPAEVLGKFDLSTQITMPDGTRKPISDLAEKGVVITWIDPDKEPTKHIFNDLPLLKKELDRWGGSFVFLSDPSGSGMYFLPGQMPGLPENTLFSSDDDFKLLEKACGAISCSTVRLPLMLLVSKEGSILFRSEGYRIGIGEQLLKKVQY